MSLMSQKHLQDESAAYDWVEARVWPHGPTCPHCGEKTRVSKMRGKATRIGLYKCYKCRKQFNVKIGTIFEKSHVPLRLWLQAIYLIVGSKKGISSNQLHRTLGVTLKTAWFMGHRIREAMRSGELGRTMGGGGGSVEMDETYFGKKEGKQVKKGNTHLSAVVSLVDRTSGEVRSFKVDKVNSREVSKIALRNIDREAKINTDEAAYYNDLTKVYELDRQSVNHSKMEWRRGDVTTNTVEGYFSIFKRGMKGIYQHCSEKHLHRYLAEYDFRYTHRVAKGVDDEARAELAVKGIVGKRLTYRTPDKGMMQHAQEKGARP